MFSISYSISAGADHSPESFQGSDFKLTYVCQKARPETLKSMPKSCFLFKIFKICSIFRRVILSPPMFFKRQGLKHSTKQSTEVTTPIPRASTVLAARRCANQYIDPFCQPQESTGHRLGYSATCAHGTRGGGAIAPKLILHTFACFSSHWEQYDKQPHLQVAGCLPGGGSYHILGTVPLIQVPCMP